MTPTHLKAILAEREGYAPCPTCHQYSHSLGDDAVARAYNHFHSMYAHPVRGHPMGNNFDDKTRDAAQVLATAIRNRPTPASEEADGWLPIESADLTKSPRKVVDLWVVHTSCTGRLTGERSVNCAYYRESATHAEGWHDQHGNKIEWRVDPDDVDEGNDPNEGRTVTHWRPLPAPPSTLARP